MLAAEQQPLPLYIYAFRTIIHRGPLPLPISIYGAFTVG